MESIHFIFTIEWQIRINLIKKNSKKLRLTSNETLHKGLKVVNVEKKEGGISYVSALENYV